MVDLASLGVSPFSHITFLDHIAFILLYFLRCFAYRAIVVFFFVRSSFMSTSESFRCFPALGAGAGFCILYSQSVQKYMLDSHTFALNCCVLYFYDLQTGAFFSIILIIQATGSCPAIDPMSYPQFSDNVLHL